MTDHFRRLLPCLLVQLCIAFVPVLSAENVELSNAERDALLKTLKLNLSPIKSLCATFDQTKRLALFDEELTAKGAICFMPGKIRFEIRSPFRSVLLVVDKNVAKYEHGKGDRWKRLDVKNADGLALVMQQIGDWMQGNFQSQSRIFAISALKRGEKTHLILTSKPKRFAKYIKRIEIRLADDLKRFEAITIVEPGGDSTVLAFTGDDRAKVFPKGTFDLDRKQPVDVGYDKK